MKKPGKQGVRATKSRHLSLFVLIICSLHIFVPLEKGQVEHGVGYTRRNAMVPLPEASDYADLNRQLLERCLQEDHRRVWREATTIGEAWQQERSHLLPLPPFGRL